MSASSDSRLLDEQGRAEAKVVLRHKRPPRPKSECLLSQDSRVTKRYSAFGVSAAEKLEMEVLVLTGRGWDGMGGGGNGGRGSEDWNGGQPGWWTADGGREGRVDVVQWTVDGKQ